MYFFLFYCRFGIGRFTTEDEIDFTADLTIKHVTRLREMRYKNGTFSENNLNVKQPSFLMFVHGYKIWETTVWDLIDAIVISPAKQSGAS